MPLRSVEAATRDDAIAAAREQFGPQARVVGVRRVRSGGVLGFFATERYVAEVAPDVARPPVPSPGRSVRSDDLGASPLASASPATAAPSSARPRAGAPARNGAAAYAAEAVRPATQAAVRSLGWTADVAAETPVDDARVSELAGLLGAPAAEPRFELRSEPRSEPRSESRPTPYARPYGGVQRATFAKAPWTAALEDTQDDAPAPALPAADGPSPFTAALARMVAGDSSVRQAVEDAVGTSEDRPAAATGSRTVAERRPARSTPAPSADTAVWPRAARQEEETVEEQVIAPPSMSDVQPVEVPTWAAEPEVATAPDSSREEAIAEVLRSALAQGHSDEALAGILRKVLDGVAPQAALPEPVVEPVAEPVAVAPEPQPVFAEPVFEAPVFDEPAYEAPVVPEPVVDQPVAMFEAPAPTHAPPAYQYQAPIRPTFAFEPFLPSALLPVIDIWGASTSTPLWGEASTSTPVVRADAPIWAEVVLGEPAPVPEVLDEPVAEEVDEAPVEEIADEVTVEDIAVVEVEDEVVEEALAEETLAEETLAEETLAEETLAEEPVVEEAAPLLARTASDPAPFALPMSMSLDATSVMPPLSLLPPLPSSRGRGRPPVPPATSRPPVPPARPAAEAAPATRVAEEPAPVAPPLPVPATRSLATVTRLPVAPLMAGSDIPELSEEDLARLENPAPPAAEPAVVPIAIDEPVREEPVAAEPEAVPVPGDVVSRLAALGVPPRLLGADFVGDVERHGLYSALTRALGLRLPAAPELPTGAGEVLFVVGPGVETLRAARRIAASLCLDPDRVQWATPGDLAGLAPEGSRVTTTDGAIARRHDAAQAGTVTIVAVDAPMRADAYWMRQMLAIWSPVAVWAVVEATRKPEDVEPWLDGMARVDALIVQDTDLSADPAAVLHRVAAPVAVLDGVRATPHRWASLLCERLEGAPA